MSTDNTDGQGPTEMTRMERIKAAIKESTESDPLLAELRRREPREPLMPWSNQPETPPDGDRAMGLGLDPTDSTRNYAPFYTAGPRRVFLSADAARAYWEAPPMSKDPYSGILTRFLRWVWRLMRGTT